MPNSKYYDVYSSSTVTTAYNRRKLGDATGEMGPLNSAVYSQTKRYISSWYSDLAHFPIQNSPFFVRSGGVSDGINTGMFSFFPWKGNAGEISFRVVLTVSS